MDRRNEQKRRKCVPNKGWRVINMDVKNNSDINLKD